MCNTENFVPIVVPGLSMSSSSSSHPSTSMTPSRQESHHPTSSLHSSSSPTTTASSDSETGEKEDCVKIKCWRDDGTVRPVVCVKYVERTERGDPLLTKSTKNPQKQMKTKTRFRTVRLVKFRHVGMAARIQVSLEPTTKRREDLGDHSVYTHFPKDRNCEICKRTTITRAPCRRRNGEAVLRVEKYGELMTTDHKVLSDNCES